MSRSSDPYKVTNKSYYKRVTSRSRHGKEVGYKLKVEYKPES